MKKILRNFSLIGFFVFFYLLSPLAFFQIVSAHVLKTDGSIGAVVHIDPEDDPIAGAPAHFYFEFKDRDGKFSVTECNCTFSVYENGKELISEPVSLSGSDLNSAVVTFIFPQKDIYQVKVEGSAKDGSLFQKFSLSYDIRVERETDGNLTDTSSQMSTPFLSQWWYYLLAAIVIVGVLGLLYIKPKKAD